jgi:site-specific DNA-methyltransferase (adenine-specific)
LPRLDRDAEARARLAPRSRLRPGEIWRDPEGRHRVGCLDAGDPAQISALLGRARARLAVHDPPYNLGGARDRRPIDDYLGWCERWLRATLAHLAAGSDVSMGR